IRSLSPSTTLVWTRTESPTLNRAESFRNCSDSILSNNAWLINFILSPVFPTGRAGAPASGRATVRSAIALFAHDCPTATLPGLASPGTQQAAYNADIRATHG